MKNKMAYVGIAVLLVVFIGFYTITSYLLEEKQSNNVINVGDITDKNSDNHQDEEAIVKKLYTNVRMLYDVVNNKFKVNQDDVIQIGNVTYKKITNFDNIMNDLFTEDGIYKYIADLDDYFAVTSGGYYLAGNLVTYQTYYFRGDNTNIYVTDVSENKIKAIIYEQWKSNNSNTLATIEVVSQNNKWLINDITILASK